MTNYIEINLCLHLLFSAILSFNATNNFAWNAFMLVVSLLSSSVTLIDVYIYFSSKDITFATFASLIVRLYLGFFPIIYFLFLSELAIL